MTEIKVTTMAIPADLKNEIEKIARQRGMTRNGLVMSILGDFVRKLRGEK